MVVGTFAAFRLLAVLFVKPGGEVYVGAYDYRFYWQMAELSLEGHYPFVDFWLEYPPLFPWLLVGIYKVSLLLPTWQSPILWFQLGVGSFLALCDVGNVGLIYAIAGRLHGRASGLRAAWLYAGLFFPLYVVVNWFDAFPLFFLLLTVWATLRGWPLLAGLAAGVGFMAKIIPAVIAPIALLAWRTWRERVLVVALATATVLAVAVPFLLRNPTMLLASFQSMFARSSWLTPWAFLEGYFDVGYMPPWPVRFLADQASWQMHPATLPWALVYGVFGGLLLVLYTRRLAWPEPRVLVAAAGLSINLFLLFNKGWSPAFLVYPLAFLAITMPNGWGLGYALLLTFNTFVEWPLAGVYFRDVRWLWWAFVLMRTALLLLLSWEYLTQLSPRLRDGWQTWRSRLAVPAVAVLAVAALVGGWTLWGRYEVMTPQYPVVTFIRSLSQPGQALVASSREAFYGLKPYFPDDAFASPREDLWADDKAAAATLVDATRGASQAWVVLDHATGDQSRRDAVVAWFDRWGSLAGEKWFGSLRVLGYVPYAGADAAKASAVKADFGGQFSLAAWSGSQDLRLGSTLRVLLYWQATGKATADYKVFVHLADANGKVVAQRDKPLRYQNTPAPNWPAGTLAREAYDVAVPADAPAGTYHVVVGIYDPNSGNRLVVGGDPSHTSVSLGDWQIAASAAEP